MTRFQHLFAMGRLPHAVGGPALVALVVLLTPLIGAGDTDPATDPHSGEATIVVGPVAMPTSALVGPASNPLHTAITELLAREHAQLVALRTRLDDAPDPASALALTREAEALKLATQRNVLELQLSWARESGQATAAQDLEAVLARLPGPSAATAEEQPAADPSPGKRQGE